jgi:hypothetical protein
MTDFLIETFSLALSSIGLEAQGRGSTTPSPCGTSWAFTETAGAGPAGTRRSQTGRDGDGRTKCTPKKVSFSPAAERRSSRRSLEPSDSAVNGDSGTILTSSIDSETACARVHRGYHMLEISAPHSSDCFDMPPPILRTNARERAPKRYFRETPVGGNKGENDENRWEASRGAVRKMPPRTQNFNELIFVLKSDAQHHDNCIWLAIDQVLALHFPYFASFD